MTIAVCYLTPEGVILGADSTTSLFNENGAHYFNFNQKVFEIGENSTLGFVTWGMGEINKSSLRKIVADVADDFKASTPSSLQSAADRMADIFWGQYTHDQFYTYFKQLEAKPAFGSSAAAAPVIDHAPRTKDEEEQFNTLSQNLQFGFCIGGYILPDRTPAAIIFDFLPSMTQRPSSTSMQPHSTVWKGVPNMIQRLIKGWDNNLRIEILNSGFWVGNQQQLDDILARQSLAHQIMPVRDAIDYVYTCIHSTIKAMKFSSLPQVCGGPIEIAVITVDRNFRWVKHKSWDSAIRDGDS